MAIRSEAQKKAVAKYNAANYEQIQLRVEKGKKETIKAFAESRGESLNGFINRAIDEAIRVTKPGGVILFAFISVFAIMYADYFYGRWTDGQEMNFTEDYKVKHFKEQLFTGYDVTEFEELFQKKPVEWITTTGVDGLLEPIEKRPDFSLSDEDFKALAEWYLAFSEKRELLGTTNHLLYICRKRRQ